jgi:ferredoxin-NADP reductase
MGELIVNAIRDETASVKTFSLRHPSDRELPFKFLSGQFLTVTVPDGPTQVHRCYTISSSPTREDACEITVKREGIASSLLHDRIVVGAPLRVSGPYGRFTFDEGDARPVVFIAGGVGITPLMSKLRYLIGRQWSGKIDLVYSVKTSDDIIFWRELEELGRQSQTLGVHITVTAGDGSWTGARGRMNREWLRSVIPDIAEREVHLCGPTSMAASVQSLLAQMGVPAHKIAIEAFGGRKEPSSRDGTEIGHEVRFNRSNVSGSAQGGELLLDTAIAAGVAIDFGCRAGVCGRCKAKLLDGQITTHGEFALAPEEKAAQFFLMCQAEAASDLIIDC